MTDESFIRGMDDLQDHFNKRIKDTRFYWDEVKHIPDEAWKDIVRWRVRSHAPQPSNFPTIQALIDAYSGPGGWLDHNPSSRAKAEVWHCQYCEPAAPGTIEVGIPLEKPMYPVAEMNFRNTVVRCGHCRNWEDRRNPTWPRLRVQEIEARGWTVLTKEHPLEDEEQGWQRVSRPSEARRPGMRHIEESLPVGDRDEEIPF